MASFSKRPGKNGTSYLARVRVQGKTRTATFGRLTDAREWANATETDLKRRKHVPTSAELRRTLADLIDAYLEDVLPAKRHNKDQATPRYHLKWWRDELGKTRLVDLTSEKIARYRNNFVGSKSSQGRSRSPATANRYLVTLSHVLSIGVRWKWLHDNPARSVDKLREGKGRDRILSDDEQKALLEACRASRSKSLYPIVVLALSTGMRRGEILKLTHADLDFERGSIRIPDTKNGDVRIVPLLGYASSVLKEWTKIRRLDSRLVFPGSDPNKPIAFREGWLKALETAKISDFRFHDLRHTAASRLAMSGASLIEIAQILGHRTLSMVQRYSHLTETHKSSVLERMNEQAFGNG